MPIAKTEADVHDYLRQHATRAIGVMYRPSMADRRKPHPTQSVVVMVFAMPGPEHERTPTRRDQKEMKKAFGREVDTISDGPEPLMFFTTRRVVQGFINRLKDIRRDLAQHALNL